MTSDTFTLAPTVLVRHVAHHPGEGEDTLAAVTVGSEADEALVVFRGPEDAWAYQRDTEKHTADEGFIVLGLTDDALHAMLEKFGLAWVAMPGPWGDGGEVDLFTAENFLGMLAEFPPA